MARTQEQRSSSRKRTRSATKKVDAQHTVMVRTTVHGTESETRDVEVETFITEPAYVRASAGLTKNLGDYESLRVDVAITVPCYKEMVEEVYESVAEQVAVLLETEIDKYMDEG